MNLIKYRGFTIDFSEYESNKIFEIVDGNKILRASTKGTMNAYAWIDEEMWRREHSET